MSVNKKSTRRALYSKESAEEVVSTMVKEKRNPSTIRSFVRKHFPVSKKQIDGLMERFTAEIGIQTEEATSAFQKYLTNELVKKLYEKPLIKNDKTLQMEEDFYANTSWAERVCNMMVESQKNGGLRFGEMREQLYELSKNQKILGTEQRRVWAKEMVTKFLDIYLDEELNNKVNGSTTLEPEEFEVQDIIPRVSHTKLSHHLQDHDNWIVGVHEACHEYSWSKNIHLRHENKGVNETFAIYVNMCANGQIRDGLTPKEAHIKYVKSWINAVNEQKPDGYNCDPVSMLFICAWRKFYGFHDFTSKAWPNWQAEGKKFILDNVEGTSKQVASKELISTAMRIAYILLSNQPTKIFLKEGDPLSKLIKLNLIYRQYKFQMMAHPFFGLQPDALDVDWSNVYFSVREIAMFSGFKDLYDKVWFWNLQEMNVIKDLLSVAKRGQQPAICTGRSQKCFKDVFSSASETQKSILFKLIFNVNWDPSRKLALLDLWQREETFYDTFICVIETLKIKWEYENSTIYLKCPCGAFGRMSTIKSTLIRLVNHCKCDISKTLVLKMLLNAPAWNQVSEDKWQERIDSFKFMSVPWDHIQGRVHNWNLGASCKTLASWLIQFETFHRSQEFKKLIFEESYGSVKIGECLLKLHTKDETYGVIPCHGKRKPKVESAMDTQELIEDARWQNVMVNMASSDPDVKHSAVCEVRSLVEDYKTKQFSNVTPTDLWDANKVAIICTMAYWQSLADTSTPTQTIIGLMSDFEGAWAPLTLRQVSDVIGDWSRPLRNNLKFLFASKTDKLNEILTEKLRIEFAVPVIGKLTTDVSMVPLVYEAKQIAQTITEDVKSHISHEVKPLQEHAANVSANVKKASFGLSELIKDPWAWFLSGWQNQLSEGCVIDGFLGEILSSLASKNLMLFYLQFKQLWQGDLQGTDRYLAIVAIISGLCGQNILKVVVNAISEGLRIMSGDTTLLTAAETKAAINELSLLGEIDEKDVKEGKLTIEQCSAFTGLWDKLKTLIANLAESIAKHPLLSTAVFGAIFYFVTQRGMSEENRRRFQEAGTIAAFTKAFSSLFHLDRGIKTIKNFLKWSVETIYKVVKGKPMYGSDEYVLTEAQAALNAMSVMNHFDIPQLAKVMGDKFELRPWIYMYNWIVHIQGRLIAADSPLARSLLITFNSRLDKWLERWGKICKLAAILLPRAETSMWSFAGESRVGKTEAIKNIIAGINEQTTMTKIQPSGLDPSDAYMSGQHPYGNTFICDDRGPSDCAEFQGAILRMGSPFGGVIAGAELADKKQPLYGRLLIETTNNEGEFRHLSNSEAARNRVRMGIVMSVSDNSVYNNSMFSKVLYQKKYGKYNAKDGYHYKEGKKNEGVARWNFAPHATFIIRPGRYHQAANRKIDKERVWHYHVSEYTVLNYDELKAHSPVEQSAYRPCTSINAVVVMKILRRDWEDMDARIKTQKDGREDVFSFNKDLLYKTLDRSEHFRHQLDTRYLNVPTLCSYEELSKNAKEYVQFAAKNPLEKEHAKELHNKLSRSEQTAVNNYMRWLFLVQAGIVDSYSRSEDWQKYKQALMLRLKCVGDYLSNMPESIEELTEYLGDPRPTTESDQAQMEILPLIVRAFDPRSLTVDHHAMEELGAPCLTVPCSDTDKTLLSDLDIEFVTRTFSEQYETKFSEVFNFKTKDGISKQIPDIILSNFDVMEIDSHLYVIKRWSGSGLEMSMKQLTHDPRPYMWLSNLWTLKKNMQDQEWARKNISIIKRYEGLTLRKIVKQTNLKKFWEKTANFIRNAYAKALWVADDVMRHVWSNLRILSSLFLTFGMFVFAGKAFTALGFRESCARETSGTTQRIAPGQIKMVGKAGFVHTPTSEGCKESTALAGETLIYDRDWTKEEKQQYGLGPDGSNSNPLPKFEYSNDVKSFEQYINDTLPFHGNSPRFTDMHGKAVNRETRLRKSFAKLKYDSTSVCVTMIKTGLAVTVYHSGLKVGHRVNVIQQSSSTYAVVRKLWRPSPSSDLLFIHVVDENGNPLGCKDISRNFLTTEQYKKRSQKIGGICSYAIIPTINKMGLVDPMISLLGPGGQIVETPIKIGTTEKVVMNRIFIAHGVVDPGDSGSPVFLCPTTFVKNQMGIVGDDPICGLVSARARFGGDRMCLVYVSIVLLEDVIEAVKNLDLEIVVEGVSSRNEMEWEEMVNPDLYYSITYGCEAEGDEKVLRNPYLPDVKLDGVVDKAVAGPVHLESEYIRNSFADDIEEIFIDDDIIQPTDVLAPSKCSISDTAFDEEGNEHFVLNQAISRYQKGLRKNVRIKDGVDALAASMLEMKHNFLKWRMLTVEEAIIGIYPHLNRMNPNTSAGWPWMTRKGSKGKKDCFSFDEEGNLVPGRKWDLFVRRVNHYIEDAKMERDLGNIEVGFPKTELLPKKKHWRTRTICNPDVAWTVAARMVMGVDIYNFIAYSQFGGSSLVGINVNGPSGTFMANKHLAIGQNNSCMDVKNFDGSHTLEEEYAAWDVFHRVNDELGCDTQDNENRRKWSRHFLTSSMLAPLLVGTCVVTKEAGMSSGAPWTTILNTILLISLINQAIIEWLQEKGFRNPHQWWHIIMNFFAISCLGDDSLVTWDDEFARLGFNSIVLQNFFEKTGRTVTSGFEKIKNEEDATVDGVTILSHSFVPPSGNFPYWSLKLKPGSTLGMLSWTRVGELPFVEQQKINVHTALLELVHDRKLYERVRGVLRKKQLPYMVPTWKESWNAWLTIYAGEFGGLERLRELPDEV